MNHIWIKMKSIDCGVFLSKRSVWNYLDSCKIYFVLDCKSLTISFLRRIPGHRRAIAIVSNCVVVECKTAMQISRIFDDCLRIILLGIPATARTTRVETPTWGRTFCDFEETIYDFDAKIQNCKLLIKFDTILMFSSTVQFFVKPAVRGFHTAGADDGLATV